MAKTRKRTRGKVALLAPWDIQTATAARLAGMHPATLRRWAERGAINPISYGSGRGKVYGWGLADIIAARAIRRLRERVSAQRLRRVIKALKRYGEDLTSAVLIEQAGDIYRVVSADKLVRVLDGQESIRFVELAPIEKGIRSQARKEGIRLTG